MPRTNLNQHIKKINKILSDNQAFFYNGVATVVRPQKIHYKNEIYEVKSGDLFLKTTQNILPCIKILETWINDEEVSYTYRFEVPYFEYCFACVGSCEKVRYKTFEFRYELHNNILDHEPKYHLHVLDGVLPRYHTNKIEFEDFINIIKREFIKDNTVKFKY